jgi:hypothetical protein
VGGKPYRFAGLGCAGRRERQRRQKVGDRVVQPRELDLNPGAQEDDVAHQRLVLEGRAEASVPPAFHSRPKRLLPPHTDLQLPNLKRSPAHGSTNLPSDTRCPRHRSTNIQSGKRSPTHLSSNLPTGKPFTPHTCPLIFQSALMSGTHTLWSRLQRRCPQASSVAPHIPGLSACPPHTYLSFSKFAYVGIFPHAPKTIRSTSRRR